MHYEEMEEVMELVRGFEEQRLPLEAWNHVARLAVSCWYAMKDPDNAEARMRDGIQRLNGALDVIATPTSGYHETLTVFWMAKVRALVEVCEGTDIAVLNAVVGGLADKDLVLFHYSSECITSAEARLHWVEPDLVRLPMDDAATWEAPRRVAV